MRSNLKKLFSILCVGLLCGYAAWRGMEWVTIASMLMFIALVYFDRTKDLFEIGTGMLQNAQQLRFRELELQLGRGSKKLSDISNKESDSSAWIELLMTQLNAQQLGLILQIHRSGRLRQQDGISFSTIITTLRHLRGLGLIYHNESTMGRSTEVWLTELGKEFSEVVYSDLVHPTGLDHSVSTTEIEDVVVTQKHTRPPNMAST